MENFDLGDTDNYELIEVSSLATSSQQQAPFIAEISARGADSNVEMDDGEFFVARDDFDEPFCRQALDDGEIIRVYSTENATVTASSSTSRPESAWKVGSTQPANLVFSSPHGLQAKVNGDTPLHYLKLMVTDKMVETIANETNRYATQTLSKKQYSPSSKYRQWVDTTTDEMWAFLGLIIAMGLIAIDNLSDYWSMDEVYTLPFFSSVMTKDRFYLILTFLHLSNNELQLPPDDPNYDPLSKLGSFIRDLTTNFRTAFLPGKNITVDEAAVAWRGPHKSQVCNPNKPVDSGIKVFQLCDSATAYCCNLEIHTGKTPASKHGLAYDVVERLITPYLYAGRTLYVHNYFTSPELFSFLRDRGTLACGTLRADRENGPPKELTPQFNKGDTNITALTDGKLNYFGFMDKAVVQMLSTAHTPNVVNAVSTSTKEPTTKLQAVHDYNHFTSAVSRCDQMVSTKALKGQNLKWWKKAFFHMFMLGVLNAYLVCRASCGKFSCSRIFRKDLAKQLVQYVPLLRNVPGAGRPLGPENSSQASRLTGRHFPSAIIAKEGRKSGNPQRSCVVCSQGLTRKSRYQCSICDVGLHVDSCFEIYHTIEDYRGASKRVRSIAKKQKLMTAE